MNINIRTEEEADIAAIESVTVAAFENAPYASHTEQFIVAALRRSGQLSLSLVAETDGQVIGHIALSSVTIIGSKSNWYGLGPVSVLPEYQRRGIGSRLIENALKKMRNTDASGCVLLGEPEYYKRFGFRQAAGLILEGVPPAYFLALPFRDAVPQGTVKYHLSFDAKA